MLCKELSLRGYFSNYENIENIWGSNNSYRINLSLESVSRKVGKLIFTQRSSG